MNTGGFSTDVDRVLDRAERDGLHVLLLDGSFIPTDRPGNPRVEHAHYSGKHHATGMLVRERM